MLKKILFLLSKKEKKNFYILLFLIIVMNTLDTLGVASILPFIAILTNPEILNSNSELHYFISQLKFLGISSYYDFVFVSASIFLFLFISSILFKSFVFFFQINFAFMREQSICERLTKHYAHQPYVWFLNRNSSELTKNVLSETGQVIFGSIFGMLNFLSNIVLILMILTLLFFINQSITVILLLTFSITYGSVFFFIKTFKNKFSNERLVQNQKRFQALSEFFNLIKLSKINNKESFFLKRFNKAALTYAKNNSFANAVGSIPRYLVELISFGGIIIFILITVKQSANFNELLPLYSLYVFAGYKLLPSMHQAYQSKIQMKHASAGLKNLYYELNEHLDFQKKKESKEKINNIKFEKFLELQNISYKYPNSKNTVLYNVDMKIPAFTKVGILGMSGSGKSTLMDIILCLLKADSGKLLVDEVDITQINKKSWQNKIGYVPQQIILIDDSVAANIAFGIDVSKIDFERVVKVSKIANLNDFIMNELIDGYNTIIGENGAKISGGQKQRIAIARALYNDPSVIIFDEATSSLDQFTEKAVLDAINNLEGKKTIITITHKLSTIKNFDLIFLIENGKIKLKGTYDDVQKVFKDKI